MDEPGRARVMEAVERRMSELSISKAELARRSDVSTKTIGKVLSGGGVVKVDVRRQLARGLGWTEDSLDRIARGDEPVEATTGTEPNEDRLERMERILAELVTEIRNLSALLSTQRSRS